MQPETTAHTYRLQYAMLQGVTENILTKAWATLPCGPQNPQDQQLKN